MNTRLVIIQRLHQRLESYSWANFGPTVFTGRVIFDPDTDPLPIVTIVPGVETSEKTRYGSDKIEMMIDVSAILSLDDEDSKNITEICEPIFAELKKALLSPSQIFIDDKQDEYATIIYTGGGISDYPQDIGPSFVSIGVAARISFEQYLTNEL